MKPSDMCSTLAEGEGVLGAMVIEDGAVVQKTGNIAESLAPHFIKLVNVGLSEQLVENEQFQSMNVNYPFKLTYSIAVAGKRIYVVKRALPPAPEDDDEKTN